LPFEQADSSTTRRFGGTGLGLSISKKLTQMMGGDTGCQSRYGVGSVFWCEIPLPESSEAQSGVRSGIKGPGEQNAVSPTSKVLNILLVDDVKVNLIVLSSMLQQWGHVTETAENGKQAIELVKIHHYDMIFMDCQMPEMDGYECTQLIRLPETSALNPKMPIIAVTAHAMTGDKERCLDCGMDDYISKPIDLGELQSKLIQWMPK
jgi:CheY-like chemotaxis protein